MLRDGQIWNVDAIEETVGESNGSSRDFQVHDGPNWDSMTPVDVVIKLRDDKGRSTSFGGATSAYRRGGIKPPLAIGPLRVETGI